MNVTDTLLLLDPSLKKHNEGEWSNTDSRYSAFNDAGVECETGEFLYSMVRILKPEHILETGTHWGIGASYMGMAAKDNNYGKVTTIEFIPENYQKAVERFRILGLTNFVESVLGRVEEYKPAVKYGFIFLDTEPITRFSELVYFYEHLSPGGFMFIHDTPRTLCQGNINTDHPEIPSWPFGNIPAPMRELVKNGNLRPFHFPTPRGLVGFYKTHSEDIKW